MGQAIAWFTSQGMTVSLPLTDSQDYDLVVGQSGESLQRVQIKTTNQVTPSGAYKAQFLVCGGNRSGTGVKKYLTNSPDIDVFLVITGESKGYLIPRKDIEGRSNLNLSGPNNLGEQYRLW